MKFQASKIKNQNLAFRTPCTRGATRKRWVQAPHSALRIPNGFTYLALLAAIIIIGISMGAAGKYWQNVVQREKEEELLFRGDQYAQAIERYYSAVPGRVQYPASLDDLLKDERTPTGKRYLRQKYKDPMTGEDFVEIRDPSNRITGVYSASDKTPLKQTNFCESCQGCGAHNKKYSEWKFVYTAPSTSLTHT